jgi:hypothetical protein
VWIYLPNSGRKHSERIKVGAEGEDQSTKLGNRSLYNYNSVCPKLYKMRVVGQLSTSTTRRTYGMP